MQGWRESGNSLCEGTEVGKKTTHSRKGRKGMCWCRVICRRLARGQGPNLTPGSQLPGSLYPISVPPQPRVQFLLPILTPLADQRMPMGAWDSSWPHHPIRAVQCGGPVQTHLGPPHEPSPMASPACPPCTHNSRNPREPAGPVSTYDATQHGTNTVTSPEPRALWQ